MRLYCKLGLFALAACLAQWTLSSGTAREAYFAARCYVASQCGDCELEHRLVSEFQRRLVDRSGVRGETSVAAVMLASNSNGVP